MENLQHTVRPVRWVSHPRPGAELSSEPRAGAQAHFVTKERQDGWHKPPPASPVKGSPLATCINTLPVPCLEMHTESPHWLRAAPHLSLRLPFGLPSFPPLSLEDPLTCCLGPYALQPSLIPHIVHNGPICASPQLLVLMLGVH